MSTDVLYDNFDDPVPANDNIRGGITVLVRRGDPQQDLAVLSTKRIYSRWACVSIRFVMRVRERH